MGESGTAAVRAAASPQEALGYESRGGEAKRRENGGDGRESVVTVYIPRMGKKSGNTQDFEGE